MSEKKDIAFNDIVGKAVTIQVRLGDDSDRYFNGFVSRFVQGLSDSKFTHYQMEIVPWLWMLTRKADCRIFQKMTAPDVIAKVFKDGGFTDFKNSLTGSFEELEYCVQYRESDFNFVSRLMQQFGIFYYFEHEESNIRWSWPIPPVLINLVPAKPMPITTRFQAGLKMRMW